MPARWGSVGHLYDLHATGYQGFGGSSKGRTVTDGYAPSDAVLNHVKFATKAVRCVVSARLTAL